MSDVARRGAAEPAPPASSDFACACCAATEGRPAGTYSLPARRAASGQQVTMTYPIAECCTCGHVQAHPPPAALDIAGYYREGFWQDHGTAGTGVTDDADEVTWLSRVTATSGLWERYQRAGRQLDFLTRSTDLRSDTIVIDLGSGYSPFLARCAERGLTRLHALEPSPEVCAFLDRQSVITYPVLLEEFVERDDLPAFDVMVISHTVEHLVDPASVLMGLRRLLAPGGVIYVDVPYQDHLRPYHQGLHLQFFNERSMSRLLERSGLDATVVDADTLGPADRAVMQALYAVYGRFFGGRGGVGGSGRLEQLHRLVWRPLKRLLGLRVNIFISSQDLRVLAGRASEHPAPDGAG